MILAHPRTFAYYNLLFTYEAFLLLLFIIIIYYKTIRNLFQSEVLRTRSLASLAHSIKFPTHCLSKNRPICREVGKV